jgi:hypothetical protein
VAKLDIAANSGQILAGDAGCNAGFTGIGFATTFSGCTNYSILGNGTDTILNRPAGGSLFLREANSTQFVVVPGGAIGIGTASPSAKLTVSGPGGFTTAGAPRFDLINTTNSPVGFSQYVTGDGIWQLSTNAGALRITADLNGFVGIGGNPNAIARLSVSGNIRATAGISLGSLASGGTTQVCWNGQDLSFCSSSIRYKSNIRSYSAGLNLVKRLRPVSFNWRSNDAPDVGLVAEDVAKLEPNLVTRNDKGEVEGVKYDRVGVVLVNAVNEEQVQIENQQKQIDAQKAIIERQQAEIEALKTLVCSKNRSAKLCGVKR